METFLERSPQLLCSVWASPLCGAWKVLAALLADAPKLSLLQPGQAINGQPSGVARFFSFAENPQTCELLQPCCPWQRMRLRPMTALSAQDGREFPSLFFFAAHGQPKETVHGHSYRERIGMKGVLTTNAQGWGGGGLWPITARMIAVRSLSASAGTLEGTDRRRDAKVRLPRCTCGKLARPHSLGPRKKAGSRGEGGVGNGCQSDSNRQRRTIKVNTRTTL